MDQLAPKQKRVLMVVSPDAKKEGYAEGFVEACKKNSISTETLDIKDAYDYKEISEKLLNWLSLPENITPKKIILNATGGTKIMSMAAQLAFASAGQPMLYVKPNDNSVMLFPDVAKADAHSTLKLRNPLRMRDYLLSYGYKMSPPNKSLLKFPAFGATLIGDIEKYEYALATLNRTVSERNDENAVDFSFKPANDEKKCGVLLELCSRDEYKLLRPHSNGFSFPDLAKKKYVCSGWLEEYVFDVLSSLKTECAIQDKGCNVVVNSFDYKVENELDVAFLANNRLHIIECKSGWLKNKPGSDALYKLPQIASDKGLNTKKMLISYRGLGVEQLARAKKYNLAVVQKNELPQLKARLKKWIKEP
jgi:hypothetical protein